MVFPSISSGDTGKDVTVDTFGGWDVFDGWIGREEDTGSDDLSRSTSPAVVVTSKHRKRAIESVQQGMVGGGGGRIRFRGFAPLGAIERALVVSRSKGSQSKVAPIIRK